MSNPTCPVCTHSDFVKIVTLEKWSVLECTHCSLGITTPVPDREALSQLYGENYFQPSDANYDIHSRKFKKLVDQERHRVRFVRRCAKKGRLLDIGCGSGFFLYAARKSGFSVEGLDISDANLNLIKKSFGIEVSISPVEAMDYPEGQFDIITMWHSLEHNPDPAGIIRKCMKWLKQDGTLVIEVPNHNCIDAKMDRDKWPNWALPFHLFHFTRESLEILTRTCDLKIVSTNTYLSEFIKAELDSRFLFKPISRTVARCFDGGGIAIACKKC
jgi:2-polyprenyl-3-methyl-5-hydroxy-6-metoxy-1,4-benzoquinol methylase